MMSNQLFTEDRQKPSTNADHERRFFISLKKEKKKKITSALRAAHP
jgi:hypothetical protein